MAAGNPHWESLALPEWPSPDAWPAAEEPGQRWTSSGHAAGASCCSRGAGGQIGGGGGRRRPRGAAPFVCLFVFLPASFLGVLCPRRGGGAGVAAAGRSGPGAGRRTATTDRDGCGRSGEARRCRGAPSRKRRMAPRPARVRPSVVSCGWRGRLVLAARPPHAPSRPPSSRSTVQTSAFGMSRRHQRSDTANPGVHTADGTVSAGDRRWCWSGAASGREREGGRTAKCPSLTYMHHTYIDKQNLLPPCPPRSKPAVKTHPRRPSARQNQFAPKPSSIEIRPHQKLSNTSKIHPHRPNALKINPHRNPAPPDYPHRASASHRIRRSISSHTPLRRPRDPEGPDL